MRNLFVILMLTSSGIQAADLNTDFKECTKTDFVKPASLHAGTSWDFFKQEVDKAVKETKNPTIKTLGQVLVDLHNDINPSFSFEMQDIANLKIKVFSQVKRITNLLDGSEIGTLPSLDVHSDALITYYALTIKQLVKQTYFDQYKYMPYFSKEPPAHIENKEYRSLIETYKKIQKLAKVQFEDPSAQISEDSPVINYVHIFPVVFDLFNPAQLYSKYTLSQIAETHRTKYTSISISFLTELAMSRIRQSSANLKCINPAVKKLIENETQKILEQLDQFNLQKNVKNSQLLYNPKNEKELCEYYENALFVLFDNNCFLEHLDSLRSQALLPPEFIKKWNEQEVRGLYSILKKISHHHTYSWSEHNVILSQEQTTTLVHRMLNSKNDIVIRKILSLIRRHAYSVHSYDSIVVAVLASSYDFTIEKGMGSLVSGYKENDQYAMQSLKSLFENALTDRHTNLNKLIMKNWKNFIVETKIDNTKTIQQDYTLLKNYISQLYDFLMKPETNDQRNLEIQDKKIKILRAIRPYIKELIDYLSKKYSDSVLYKKSPEFVVESKYLYQLFAISNLKLNRNSPSVIDNIHYHINEFYSDTDLLITLHQRLMDRGLISSSPINRYELLPIIYYHPNINHAKKAFDSLKKSTEVDGKVLFDIYLKSRHEPIRVKAMQIIEKILSRNKKKFDKGFAEAIYYAKEINAQLNIAK